MSCDPYYVKAVVDKMIDTLTTAGLQTEDIQESVNLALSMRHAKRVEQHWQIDDGR